MSKSITLTVSHPRIPAGPIEGFKFLWAFYVRAYRPEFHCQRCFIGRRVDEFPTRTASSGTTTVLDRLDRYPYVYVCGVGAGKKTELRHQNLHLPLRYKEGGIVEKPTYNGYIFRAENDVAAVFPDARGVNHALRALAEIVEKHGPAEPRPRRKAKQFRLQSVSAFAANWR